MGMHTPSQLYDYIFRKRTIHCLNRMRFISEIKTASAFFIPPSPSERGSGGFMGITLPVPLSVQFVVLFVFFFDIGIPYLAHWWITMTQCVAYTRGPDTTLTFALKVKYKGSLTCLRVRSVTSVCFGICISYAHETMCSIIRCFRATRRWLWTSWFNS